MKTKNILVFYKDSDLAEHQQVIADIKKEFHAYKVKACFCKRNRLNNKTTNDYDLVISVGGDGTLLRAAYSFRNAEILGINSNLKRSEGVLCSATSENLNEKLKQIVEGDYSVKHLTRARVFFKKTGKRYDAVNEIYIGSALSYIPSRYLLKVGKVKEIQKSSGIVVSTGLGSTAWYSSICGESFDPEIAQLRFAVREPYQGRLTKAGRRKGEITGKQKISVRSKMKGAVVAIDSIKEIPLDKEEEAEVSISPRPIKFIVFQKGVTY